MNTSPTCSTMYECQQSTSQESGGGRWWSMRSLLPIRTARAADTASAKTAGLSRANKDNLREIFDRYASIHDEHSNERFMNANDFVRRYLGMYNDEGYNRDTVALLASAADTTKDGLISFAEFSAFEAILCSPDALYQTVFEMFDRNASESVTCDEFERIIRKTNPVLDMDFDFASNFIRMYFGDKRDRALNYVEFCQLLHDFHSEQSKQSFRKYDRHNRGFITAVDFYHIMMTVKSHMLSTFVTENLLAIGGGSHTHLVSYPWFIAFNDMLSKIELIKSIYLNCARGSLAAPVGKEEFLLASQSYAQVTPFEVEILFQLADLRHPGKGNITFRDLELIDPERLKRTVHLKKLVNIKVAGSPQERTFLVGALEQMYRFSLGAFAGATGAFAVYPVDLVKTRMQNQRTGSFVGEVMYKNSLDCFSKVIRHEGVRGLYRGLLPQLAGVAPEKAIKLTTNDFVRDQFRTNYGSLPFWAEMVAGASGGASQVMFTNPIEIVKIRLQVAGEIAHMGERITLWSVLRDLGLRGLYKGARACFLRDIPFSAIYFPAYAHLKVYTSDSQGHCGPFALLASAAIAGMPAAFLVTPADVIKTRLQVAARAGQTTYDGLIDCARKIVAEEGHKALWKGSIARVFRSSPQFGVTLVVYEMLQRLLYVDFAGSRPIGSEVGEKLTLQDQRSVNPDHIGGYSLAVATFASIESKFGLYLPRFETLKRPPTAVGTVPGVAV